MPDTLNKQAIINLLIDSPLREAIKINLIDIVNNTNEPDLPKVYSTVVKELEIFQKATERRMKLAEETIAKLGGAIPPVTESATMDTPIDPIAPTPVIPPLAPTLSVPPLDLPQFPSIEPEMSAVTPIVDTPLPVVPPVTNFTPLGGTPMTASSDEAALAEIQKELDSLKIATATEISSAAAPIATPATPQA